jgi:hypothetical protein
VSETGLTDAEKALLEHLTAAWTAFSQLPQQSPSDPVHFMFSLRHCQDVVAARPTYRRLAAEVAEKAQQQGKRNGGGG